MKGEIMAIASAMKRSWHAGQVGAQKHLRLLGKNHILQLASRTGSFILLDRMFSVI